MYLKIGMQHALRKVCQVAESTCTMEASLPFNLQYKTLEEEALKQAYY